MWDEIVARAGQIGQSALACTPVISIVMPSHNEEAYLEGAVKSTVAGLRARNLDFEIIISENGSTDHTGAEASALAEAFGEIRVLRSETADYGRALRSGFLAARGAIVVNFDVDLVDLEFVDRCLPLIEGGADVVIGSKRTEGSKDERGLTRKFVTAVFSALLRHGFGLHVSDTHGLKALRRQPLVDLVGACGFDGDIFDTELVLRSQRAGLRIQEIPVTVEERRPPRTPIWRRIPRSLLGLWRLRLALWMKK
jgi:glycosyltransferase involved in cell wall biosynthesis